MKPTHLSGLAGPALLLFLASTIAKGQVDGSGWTSDPYSKTGHYGGTWGGHYSNVNGVETFWTFAGEQRSEIMLYKPKWSSGQHQFEGYVRVTSGSGGDGGTSTQQVMSENGVGDVAQLRVYNRNGGTLRHFPGPDIATSAYGNWVRVNVIHDANEHRIRYYINGSLKSDLAEDGAPGLYYFKYGVYLRSETNPKDEWKGIKVWKKDGSSVTFYSSVNYGGTPSQFLAKGSYTMSQLAAKGIANDSASSVKVPSGWTVTIYQSDNFGGSSWTRTSDTADFTTISGLNDTMSSCVIQ